MKKFLIIALLVLFTSPAHAAAGKMGFDLPKGWVLDKKVASNQGIDASLYPKNQTWQTAPAILYVRLAPKIAGSVQKTIEDDINGFKEINDKLVLKDEPSLYTKDGKLAFVKRLTDPANGSVSVTAYVDSGDSVSIIAIDAKNKAASAKAYPVFKALVNSYSYADKNAVPVAEVKKEEPKKAKAKKPVAEEPVEDEEELEEGEEE